MGPERQPDSSPVRRIVAHVELVNETEERAKGEARFGGAWSGRPEEQYSVTVTLTADLQDGCRISAAGFGFGGPRNGLAAIWHRYRGPELSDNPEENARLLNDTYHVGLPDIEDAINQMLGRDPDQHLPPRLAWGHLLEALVDADIEMTEQELITVPLDLELSDDVRAEIAEK